VARDRGMDVGRSPEYRRERTEESRVTLEEAMQEAEDAAQRVLEGEFSVQLTPQRPYVRRLQHMLAQRFSLASTSKGREPERGVLIYKP
jgi:predicted RNA-binding protein Jag